MQLLAVLLSTIALADSTITTPVHVAERRQLVSSPTITEPQAGSTWTIDKWEWLCWDSDPLLDDAQATATAYLGHHYDSGNNIDGLLLLASNFFTSDGCQFVHVNVTDGPADNYIVALAVDYLSDDDLYSYSGVFSIAA